MTTRKADDVPITRGTDDTAKRCAAYVAAIVHASEALVRETILNSSGTTFTPNLVSLAARMQGTSEDLLREAVASGWMAQARADDLLFVARTGRPLDERAARPRRQR